MDERERRSGDKEDTRALLPLRDLVVLPQGEASFVVGRMGSLQSLDRAMGSATRELICVTQRDAATELPALQDLHAVGTLARVLEVQHLGDGKRKVTVQGVARAQLLALEPAGDGALIARWIRQEERAERPAEAETLARAVRALHEELVKLGRLAATEPLPQAPGACADALARRLSLPTEALQELLAAQAPLTRLEILYGRLRQEMDAHAMDRRLRARARSREEDPRDESQAELAELERKLGSLDLPEDVRPRADRELRRLRAMSALSAEATVLRGWLEQVAALPWGVFAEARIDLEEARRVLDAEHHGLRKVKSRILEHLAVMKLRGNVRGTVLCLVGPPGVGKTSLARSIARATNRPFVRVALGGVRDEAEIRGHRRTYIGAMPGRIVAGLKRAGANNPVFLLDEIDKLSGDFRGDPASALLEVLDPEQNASFADHYLDLDLDLSHVLFLCTANSTASIPGPLLDRLEVVRLGGYTEQEKLRIARRHLLPQRRAAAGLDAAQLEATDAALLHLIRGYTREAGVRALQREVASVCRKVARKVVERGPDTRVKLDVARLERLLGPPKHRPTQIGAQDEPGFVHGLAWTSSGGVVVPIEATAVRGSGKTTMTGQLGSIFRESCEAAITYIRTRASQLGLERDTFQRIDVHVHVPELWGVDGPSAGITLTTAMVSAVCQIPVRRDVAMTGEVTLRGHVRPIGGVKEKLLAAAQAGVRRVLLPRENARDLRDVPRAVRESLEIRLVDHMDEVLALALAVSNPEEIFRDPPAARPEPGEAPQGDPIAS
jgi:ATP-dependent Lon protease